MRASIYVLSALSALVTAQRPANMSICDYYTTALLKENNATNQMTLLTLVVNTAVIGNYTMPNVGIAVPGILAAGTYNGTAVNLLPYFDGSYKSSNRGGSSGVSVNFLDDGGAAPLMKNMPSNGNTTSSQYMLLTHLYEYFGYLTGCSQLGMAGYPAYSGQTSMGKVHKFMDLNPYQLGYFITQVGLSAASFGVATEDVTAVGQALGAAFGYRCAAATAIPASASPDLQSICQDSTCPVSPMNATCSAYGNATAPMLANGTTVMVPGSGNSSGTSGTGASGTSTGSTSSSTSKSGANSLAMSLGAVIVAALPFALVLS
jgi:hypothetical protein